MSRLRLPALRRAAEPSREWRSRPGLARLARVVLLLAPLLLVTAAAWWVNGLLGRPASLLEGVARWTTLSVLSTIVLVGVDTALRRALPLAALLRLAIVFPDHAPSRLRVALRQGSATELAHGMKDLGNATAQEAAEVLLSAVSRLAEHDRGSRGHTERVRAHADLVAVELGLSREERTKLQWAALLHDVGKLTVPADVLGKSTALTDREQARVREHPTEGWKLVQPLRGWLGEWARATRDHHERWDGGGYPRGVEGARISRAGRIIAVVDAFDVMTSERANTVAIGHAEARDELAAGAGTEFDPEVVRAFLAASVGVSQRTRIGAWLTNSPLALQATSVAQAPAAVTSAVAAALAAAVVIGPVGADADLEPPAVERVVAAPIPVPSALPRVTSTTTTTTTTTAAPTTTTVAPTTTTTTTTTTPPTTAPPATAPPTTTAAPTTTVPPTTTSAAVLAQVTTTTLPASHFDGGYLGPMSGGTTFDLVAGLSGSGAPNPDADDNADPGLTLRSGSRGLAEIDAPHVAAWAVQLDEETSLTGRASLRLFLASPGFDETQGSGVIAGLVDCAGGTSGCTTIGQGGALFAQSAFGADFGVVIVDLGAVDHTLAAGHTLLVSLTVPQSVSSEAWLAFGTSTYPSQFRLD